MTDYYLTDCLLDSLGMTAYYLTDCLLDSLGMTAYYMTDCLLDSVGMTACYLTDCLLDSPGITAYYLTDCLLDSLGMMAYYLTGHLSFQLHGIMDDPYIVDESIENVFLVRKLWELLCSDWTFCWVSWTRAQCETCLTRTPTRTVSV